MQKRFKMLTLGTIAMLSVAGHSATAQQPPARLAQTAPAPKAPAPKASPPANQKANPPTQPSTAEQQPSPKINLPAGAGWGSRCASQSRQSAIECSIEQTLTLSNTGQLLASVVIRVPADTRQPVMMIQVPVGLYLPAGLTLQIDENKPEPLAFQTCDLKGCYGGNSVSPEMLAAMKGGKRFTITFQNLAKENISVPLTLENFADAYQKIQ